MVKMMKMRFKDREMHGLGGIYCEKDTDNVGWQVICDS